jgi:hypothetical protein
MLGCGLAHGDGVGLAAGNRAQAWKMANAATTPRDVVNRERMVDSSLTQPA